MANREPDKQAKAVNPDQGIHTNGDATRGNKVIHGDEVRGNKVGGVSIGNVAGGIHGSVIAGGDVHHVGLAGPTAAHSADPIVHSPALQVLRTLLSNLYETPDDARRIAQESGLDIGQVNFSTKPVNFWSNLLVEAHKQDRVKTLVSTASFEYAAKAEELRQAYQWYINGGK